MKQIKILKADTVEVKEYIPHSFTKNQEFLSSMQIVESFSKYSTKQAIKELAKQNSILYNDEQIVFAKQIINIMLDEINDGK